MLRRIARSFLDSQAFAIVTQSDEIWSILRWLPRSVRQSIKDLSHRALGGSLQPYPVVESLVELWPRDKSLLSVIVPCYNYGAYIREALKSLRSQTFEGFETIVVDDGSIDSVTLQVLEEFEREGIRILRQEHSGPARALNLGVSAASGKYICCLSADDTVEPTYFEKCLCLLESNPGVSFAYSYVRAFGYEDRVGVTKPFSLRLLLAYNHVCGSAVVRRKAWQTVGGFDPTMPAYEDWDFWIRLGKAGLRGRLVPESLFNWRRHRDTFGSRVDEKRPELLARIRCNHAELFSHPKRIEAIQHSYRDYRVSNPFANLSSKSLYLGWGEPLGLIITSQSPPASTRPALHDFLRDIKSQMDSRFLSVLTTRNSQKWDKELREISQEVYNLTSFLDAYCWLDFVINLITTRRIRFVLILSSKVGYDWLERIKEQCSASVIDVLLEPDEGYVRLSGKLDRFLNYHVAFSEEVSKSLVQDFGVSKAKVGVIPLSGSTLIRRNDLYSLVLNDIASLWALN
jgi:glycosyltransferase involved in cell wall biosynthesis